MKWTTFSAGLLGCVVVAGCQPQPASVPGTPITSPTAVGAPEPREPLPDVPQADLKATVEGNNAFALDLIKKLTETEKGNILISPYSIRTALAMAYAGARGQTADEMRKVLHFTLPDDKQHPAVAGLGRVMLPSGPEPAYNLGVANAVWGGRGEVIKPDYLALMASAYGGGFRELDFGRDPEGGRAVINGWVSDKTEKRIPELLIKGDIHPETVLVLTNAIYFKGEWQQRFDASKTREADFEVTPGKRVRVPLMHVSGEFRYAEHSGLRAVELPYRGDRLSMVLVLPAERHGLAKAELTAGTFAGLMGTMHERPGEVALPKLKFKNRYVLNTSLVALGMPTAFSFNADFTGLVESEVRIDQVIHAADITLDEQGTEAAAATAVTFKESATTPFTFLADEPFVYLIRDRVTGQVVFLGRYSGEDAK